MNCYRLKEAPPEEKPYEKFEHCGPSCLSDAELLAIILRSGTKDKDAYALASEVLRLCPFEKGLTGLYHLSLAELMSVSGIGRVKAIQLKCIGELAGRLRRKSTGRLQSFTDPASLAGYYTDMLVHEEVEYVYCVLLDAKNRIIGEELLTKGTASASLVSSREVFIKAVSFHASAFVLIHNHPGGDPSPSGEDVKVTRLLAEGGEILGIPLLDHIIIGHSAFFSFLEGGML